MIRYVVLTIMKILECYNIRILKWKVMFFVANIFDPFRKAQSPDIICVRSLISKKKNEDLP